MELSSEDPKPNHHAKNDILNIWVHEDDIGGRGKQVKNKKCEGISAVLFFGSNAGVEVEAICEAVI